MSQIQTVNFLPEAFRTPTNQKFLNATLDQLVTQPDLRNINAYVGRKFAPTFKSTDNYQPEPTTLRQNYQLEPSVVVKNPTTSNIDFFSSYIDIINQIEYDGGLVNNQSRLFSSENYSYDGLFDFDKFVNFTQYYWLEDSPDTVNVFGAQIPTQQTFAVTRDPSTGSYLFSTNGSVENPILRLAYGGTYTFVVNQPGYPFWIQVDPGTSGLKTNQSNLTGRDVLGVTNNGTDVGTITFSVPQPNAQDYYVRMTLAGTVNLSTTLHYNQIQGQLLSSVIASSEHGIDGVTSYNQLNLQSLIFVNNDVDDVYWTVDGVTVPVANRRNAWKLILTPVIVNNVTVDYTINMSITAQAFNVAALERVFVLSGTTRSEYTYYLNNDYLTYNIYNLMPDITAPLTSLYYQDGVDSGYAGQIDLLVVTDNTLNVDIDIVGQKNYISPNGVTFTNGLLVTFDNSANPSTYAGNSYYIEGVGTAIQLLNVDTFQTPEAYAVNGISTPDYFTINRASMDLNPWTRSNRWFHIDIINATAKYNNTVPLLDQNLRAKRPIIEFEANLQLYNFGRVAKAPVDLLDFTITDARNSVELQPAGYAISGTTLTQGMRVIFANDFDPTVRNQIFVVNIVYIQSQGGNLVNLVPAEDYQVFANNNLIVLQGINKGIEYWFDGANWNQGQQKTAVNQTPMFDIIDIVNDGDYSIGDTSLYPSSSFTTTKNNLGTVVGGSPIFTYSVGTGVADPVLGFPLSYRTFNQIGDIQFTNNYDSDTFTYVSNEITQATTTQHINSSGALQQNTSLTTYNVRNAWTTNVEASKQFQIINGIYDGNTPYFQIDITANASVSVPYFKVYINSIQTTAYEVISNGTLTYVNVTASTLAAGDQVDILIYSDQVSALGYYEVPENLDYNSANANFSVMTLGQLRNHLTTMVGNSNQVVGQVPGDSNLRDIPIKAQGGSILQHASPVMYSELFLVDPDTNFLKGLNLARYEYSKFKNKIIELSTKTPNLDLTNIPALLDTLLTQINAVKNTSFAWYYSDMVPYGSNYLNTIAYTVLNPALNDFEITNIFSDTTLSNLAVLVYKNNVQLVKDQDYTFDTTRSGVTITAPLSIGDIITINEYSSTDGNYIPETPTKLGLYPKFTPGIYLDTTYETPINVIQGHDGSITPAWGDYRDQLLLEFEKRIYNNIKVSYESGVFDIYEYVPGRFRTTDYTITEFTQLLTTSFLQWVGNNKVDYITNSYFDVSNPFTWNYNNFKDSIDVSPIPGYWRAIYKYFYDTDRPHTNPWEMLGFSQTPSWWNERYGAAPYTGGNLVLWGDLAKGYIWNGSDEAAYYDTRFARPDLLSIIPVDNTGALLPPSSFAVKSYNSTQASAPFRVGDQGPVETAWRRSSDYPFALQQTLALSAPGFYFGSLVDVSNYFKNTRLNQYVFADTLQRLTPSAININGTQVNGKIVRASGYPNWIAEYLRNQGIDPGTKLYGYLDNVSIQLAYKMAGFTDQSFVEVIAEQTSPTSTNNGVVIPNESYNIQLYKSTPTNTIVYSAVSIERTSTGYAVSGFDIDQPYFTIIPSIANNNSYPVTVLKATGIVYNDYQNYKVTVPYGFEFSNLQQVVDFLVSYQRYLLGSGVQFLDMDTDLGVQRDFNLSIQEFLTWAQQGWKANSVLVVSPILNKLTLVTASGVTDTILNQPNQSRILDINMNFIKYNQLSITRTNTVNGNTFTVTANNGQTLGLVKLDLVEYEHVMIFDNVDIFNDIIYVPELGNRQYRLKIVGKKTGSWTGALNPPGFVYNSPSVDSWQPGTDYAMGSLVKFKNVNYTALSDLVASSTFQANSWAQLTSSEIKTGLLPNFSYNAEKFNRFNDIDDPETLGDFNLYSDSTIGFHPRDYMTNFGIDEVTQAKFYQGFIRQKGSLNAITAFTAAGFNDITSNISLYEEWGMRVGEYGALSNNQFVELILTEGTFNGDPVTFTLLPNNGSSISGIIGVQPSQLYLTTPAYEPSIYLNRDASSNYENDIQTAGYVNINDVDTTIFDIGNYAQLSANLSSATSNFGIGQTIWCAKDTNSNWNVFRVTETNLSVTTVTYNIDNIGTVTLNGQHKFAYGDIIIIDGFDVRVNGFYQVYSIVDAYNINIVFYGQNLDQIKSANKITGLGPIYRLQSSRIQQSTDLNSITPPQGWLDNNKLWIDTDYVSGGWAVYNKSTPWSGNVSFFNPSMKLSTNNYVTSGGFGTVTAINSTGTFAAAGMPLYNNGQVAVFVSNIANGNVLTQVSNITALSNGVSKFGSSLDTAGNLLYVGDPGNGSSESGRVFVYTFDGNTSFAQTQVLMSPSTSNVGDTFGSAISVSSDKVWLYVGAPNAGNVYVYHANSTSYYTYANTISVGSSAYAQFGHSIKTSTYGHQTVVSAPYQSVNGVTAAGSVYVFDRSIESFVATRNVVFFTEYPINSNTLRVTVNGNVVTTGFTSNAGAITFTNAPVVGTVVTIDTNKIQLTEQLTAPTPSSGAAFGTTTWLAGNDADVYVASPGYSIPGYHSGIVYRFVNQGASYGTITGTNFAPNISVGDSIRINGFNVTFTGNTVANVATNINQANIAGVSAIAQPYGALTIVSNVATPYQKLVLGPGPGTALANLGLNVYANVQSFIHPATDDVNQFGSQVISSPDSTTLVISASGGSTQNITTFENATTMFDYGSTSFVDSIEGSGMVYIYGLVNGSFTANTPDQYVLVQRLQNNSLSPNDQFGYSVAMNSNIMLVGAPGDSNNLTISTLSGAYVNLPNAGTYYTYNNFSGNVGWDIISQQQPQVDINSISRFYLYDTTTSTILTNLDYIDPAKGKILGAAAEDLDFITAYDPAVYNAVGGVDSTPNLANSLDFHWGADQVTKTWWNIDAVRYIDYEQGNLTYRANNWGSFFPGSQVQVCEWVASSMPPSAYDGLGTPLYPNNTAYVVETKINPVTNLVTSTYYYWVYGKTSLEVGSTHKNTVSTIQSIIENPQAQGIPYAAVLRDDTISLYGVNNLLSGNSTVLHADFDTLKNTNIIHSEYQLVQEGNSSSQIPTRIVNKMIDSLSGIDSVGNPVPATGLTPQSMIGLGVNPNQTLFVNRLTALENFVQYVNGVLIQYPIIEEFNITPLYESEPLPLPTTYDLEVASYADLTYVNTSGLQVGYTILVLADETENGLWSTYVWNGSIWHASIIQSYNTQMYWDKVDWYDSTYDPTVLPTYVVATTTAIAGLSLNSGDTVKVLNNGNNQFAIYRYNSDGTTDLVGIQNGTLQFSSELYSGNVAANEIRIIFKAIQNNIFVDTLLGNFNSLFFSLINYILTEQPAVDWVFKTSFISILHQLRKLAQYPSYIPDNQTYYEEYINEVKPYRTSIREYKIDYTGTDEYYGDTTDFDIPATYLANIKAYRSPNGTGVYDQYALSSLPQYNQWYNNHTYGISDVVVTNAGVGTVTTLTVSGPVVVNTGDIITQLSTGATGVVQASVSETSIINLVDVIGTFQTNVNANCYIYDGVSNLQVNAVSVSTLTEAGGYYLTPTVSVIGGGGTGANIQAVVDFTTGKIESFQVIEPGYGYTSTPTIQINGTGIGAAGYPRLSNYYFVDSLPTVTINANANVTVYAGNIITQANTGAAGTVYTSSTGNVITLIDVSGTFASNQYIFNDYANLNTTVTSTSSYTQFINQSYNTVRTFDTTLKFDRITYSSNVVAWAPSTTILANTIVSYNGQAYEAKSNVYSSAIITLNGNVSANIGNYITQSNSTANSQIISITNNNVITVSNITGTYTNRWGNIYVNGVNSNTQPIIINNLFDYTKYNQLNANSFTTAADRIFAYYQPTASMPGKDLSQLMTGITYPGVKVTGVGFNDSTSVITSNVIYAWANSNSLFSSNVSQLDFTTLGYTIGEPLVLIDSNTSSQYNLTIASITQSQIIASGITQTIPLGANVSLQYYNFNDPTYLDTAIQNTYKNTTFGSNVGDVIIDGGRYYDTYSSHAPEELVPGVTFDNLNMCVYTNMTINGASANIGYRIVQNMQGNAASTNTALWPTYYGISPSHSTTLAANLHITDTSMTVVNASNFTVPNTEFLEPGVVFVNGEKITFWTIAQSGGNWVLGQIRRAVDGTGAPLVHVAGSPVIEAGSYELIPGGNAVHTTTWLNLPPGPSQLIADNFNDQLVANVGGVFINMATYGQIPGAVTDGLGIEASNTVEAVFIKNLT
jgi:hypothetical protein